MTPIIVAASDSGADAGSFVLLTLVAFVAYVVHCLVWPFRACRKCGGAGRFRSPSGRAWRYCDRCGGRAAQVRLGRRLWTYLANTRSRSKH
ncbi:hypothetical protein F8568_013210 [Actinomadura sp. LD22]|uniref:Uncharacterized protein n=1 Tax=Actinomadura physcomitrii TaxID=2650748 RepID=A0A6I4MAA1_9ACTN|nr:hypothetical protein [Actinomadura physcomitrii]MWA01325.1 hypothetical protein [Actinomadura physcomitrii]